MQSGFFQYQTSVVHYRTGGQGPLPLVCFHGYGETAVSFSFLEKQLGHSHFIIAIDLPFHGDTEWKEANLDGELLSGMIMCLLKHLKADTNKFKLIGFSLGGRLALCVLQQLPQHVSRVVLLAPDGLTVNFWYWLSTQTTSGNALFKWTMHHPGWFLGMLRLANKLRIINQSIYKFIEYYIHDDTVRRDLYERWTGLRNCTPSMKKITALVRQRNIPVRLLYGKYDRIIGNKRGNKLFGELPGCSVQVLDCGHQVLHQKNAEAISNALFH